MRPAKFLRLVFAHVPHACAALLVLVGRRCVGRGRRAALVLTHARDVDADGRDQQMGPLVEALRERGVPLVRVVLVPLEPAALRKARHDVGERFLSLAALYAIGRIVGRDRIAAVVFWLGGVRSCFLIDESASGQMWVRAARARGVRSVGIQHGDFRRGLAPYAHEGAQSVAPADVLCLWSDWFRERLLRVSPIYTQDNTAVTGRLAHAYRPAVLASESKPAEEIPHVLLLGEADPHFAVRVRPYLDALHADDRVQLRVRPHPSSPERDWQPFEFSQGSLEESLRWADIVIGESSSALLEALRLRRAVYLLGSADPAGLVADGLAETCADPVGLVQRCCEHRRSSRVEAASLRVWGSPSTKAPAAILRAAGIDGMPQTE